MKQFQNILLISQGMDEESDALKQAVQLVDDHSAKLKILIIFPEFPDNLERYKEKIEISFKEKLLDRVKSLSPRQAESISIEMKSDKRPQIYIIQHVLRHENDLVIKEAQIQESGKGFKSIEMDLLRKCPCPIWLYRSQPSKNKKLNIATAIDAQSQETSGNDLAVKLLTLSDRLAQQFQAELTLISCWEYELEHYLRSNAFAYIEDDAIVQAITRMQSNHRASLNKIIEAANPQSAHHIMHVRGIPETVIPKLIEDKHIDLLIMGTVARTGIPGLVIGNTAENILHKISCSLLALKPNGFVSPIKAY